MYDMYKNVKPAKEKFLLYVWVIEIWLFFCNFNRIHFFLYSNYIMPFHVFCYSSILTMINTTTATFIIINKKHISYLNLQTPCKWTIYTIKKVFKHYYICHSLRLAYVLWFNAEHVIGLLFVLGHVVCSLLWPCVWQRGPVSRWLPLQVAGQHLSLPGFAGTQSVIHHNTVNNMSNDSLILIIKLI